MAAERDDLAREPAETKLRAANSEIEAERLGTGMNALEVATYDGRDKQAILERFQA